MSTPNSTPKADVKTQIWEYACEHKRATTREIAGIFNVTFQYVSLVLREMRGRSERYIDDRFFKSKEIGHLNHSERILLLACSHLADDEGRMLADPDHLKKLIFSHDGHTPDEVLEFRDRIVAELSPRNLYAMRIYRNNGSEYLFFPNWEKLNPIRYPIPSKLPAPPGAKQSKGGG